MSKLSFCRILLYIQCIHFNGKLLTVGDTSQQGALQSGPGAVSLQWQYLWRRGDLRQSRHQSKPEWGAQHYFSSEFRTDGFQLHTWTESCFYYIYLFLHFFFTPHCHPVRVADSDRFWRGRASEDEYNASGDHRPATLQNTHLYRGGVLVSLTECIFPCSLTAWLLLVFYSVDLAHIYIHTTLNSIQQWHCDWGVGLCIIQTLVIS